MTRQLLPRFAASSMVCALLACAGSAQAQSISSGYRHVLALSKDGTVLAWGDNRDGQLGQGALRSGTTAITIPLPARIVSVRGFTSHVFALDTDGNLWSWGRNGYGQLGDGTRTDRSEPRVMLRNIVHFSGNFAVDAQGRVWKWGSNSNTPQIAAEYPVRIVKAYGSSSTIMAIDEAGGVWGWGQGGPCVFTDEAKNSTKAAPFKIPGLPPIRDLRLGEPVSNLLFTGPSSVTAVDTEGFSWSWGSLRYVAPNCQPRKGSAATPLEASYALTPDGAVLSQYDINNDAPAPVKPRLLAQLPAVRDLSIGTTYGYALTGGADLWQWPRASEAQADDGSGGLLRKVASGVTSVSTYGASAVQSVLYSTLDGQLHALGGSFDLQLGLAQEASPRSSPVAVPGLPAIASIHATGNAALAVARDGQVYGWGTAPVPILNYNYPMGISPMPALLQIPAPVRSIAMHGLAIVAIGSDGTAWQWGFPVGPADKPVDFYPPTRLALGGAAARAASISQDNALVVDTEGGVWGLGTFSSATGLVKHAKPVQQAGLPAAQQVVALGMASLALDSTGAVWAWGTDGSGSLWNSAPAGQYTPPTRILTGKSVASIHGGDGHFCAVLTDGSAQCHGNKLGGAAGKVFRLHAAITEIALSKGSPTEQPGNVHFRLADGTVWAYGEGHKGQLGVGTYGSVLEPIPVNNPAGTADLDLDPDTPAATAPAKRPPFRVQTSYSGGLGQLTLSGAVFGAPTIASAPDGKYNVYVVAIASDGPGGPPTTWFQRDDKGQWSPVQWPMPAYATKADLGTANLSVPLDIFRNFPAQGLQNSRVYVGYGIDAYEMLDAGRLREVLVMTDD